MRERCLKKKKREKEEKGREEFEWRKGGRREMQAFLNGGVFASLILGPI